MVCVDHTGRGRLISIEGLSGVGKTYLINHVSKAATTAPGQPPLVVEEFSQRRDDGDVDLGRRLLRILVTAADGEHFLRAGYPKSETLLLLAIKMHDFEATLPTLLAGRTVIEGRSIHSTAVYQSLIMHPDDNKAAAASVAHILEMAARWRSLPDLTIVITDDPQAAVRRAEARDGTTFTSEQWAVHHQAAQLFEHLATIDPSTCASSTAASTTPNPRGHDRPVDHPRAHPYLRPTRSGRAAAVRTWSAQPGRRQHSQHRRVVTLGRGGDRPAQR